MLEDRQSHGIAARPLLESLLARLQAFNVPPFRAHRKSQDAESTNAQPYAAASIYVGRADSGIPAHLASARIDGWLYGARSSCPAGMGGPQFRLAFVRINVTWTWTK
jgi:hypothetical protein